MRCPYCATDDDRVIDSRPADEGRSVRRRRSCRTCDARFSTVERVDHAPLAVVKRDGTREPFDRAKLVAGVTKAAANLDLEAQRIRDTIAAIEAQLRSGARESVTSEEIGQQLLHGLAGLHHVAYMRFASVYKGFTSPDDFLRELERLDDTGR